MGRVAEGCSMIRTKGEAGTGDVVEAVRHIRTLHKEIRFLQTMDEDEVFTFAKEIMAPVGLVQQVKRDGKLPIVNFVGSGIFKSEFPEKRARAIVKAVTHFNDPKVLAEVSEDIGDAMTGINCDDLVVRYAGREGGNMEPAAKKAKVA